MKIRNFLRSTSALVALGMVISSTQAAEIRCDNCPESSFRGIARDAGPGTQYVFDVPNGRVHKYWVEQDIEYGNVYNRARREDVEADVQLMVTELAAFYYATNATMKSLVEVTADGIAAGITSFDVARPGGDRATLLDWVQNSPTTSANGFGTAIVDFHALGMAAINIFKSVPIQTIFTIRLADGGTIDVSFDFLTDVATIVDGSIRDSAGNPIPVTPEEAAQIHFSFGNDYGNDPTAASGRMDFWLLGLGAVIVGPMAWDRNCQWDGETLTCHGH
jgi:hypothetical protein